ncbi:asparagine synthase (glutamine-hydrolyzing) [Dongia sp.]|uniref:asparagine synthase (glutamine-hydrolyzing) n=1 Tax=Dongia sp. TaxID=1977262 RepID=UPI003752A79D
MCGLAGFAGRGDRGDLIRMTTALAHRGPDGDGFHHDPDRAVFLGHRRLSILDLAGGHQPFFNEDGKVAVVYNGEIYNHRELRAELEAAGHRFKSDHSDTEVIVHGYEEWGEALPGKLNGMFAFAAYDAVRGRIFLARDRFGEKPLYYTQQNGVFAFASEVTGLAAHADLRFSIDRLGLQKFLAHGFTPAPNTIYAECCKLPAGHAATYDLATRALDIHRYWRFTLDPDESLSAADEPRLAEELKHLFFQSVQRRLISDVPLGLFLSGGVDSTASVAAAAACRPADSIDTFAIGFSDPSFDESEHSRRAAAHYGTRHHEQVLDLETAKDLMGPVLGRLDEPLGDASILPTYMVSRFARARVTVALSGDGGDELFAGYDPFKALLPARLYASLMPGALHGGLRRLADLLPISRRNMSLDFKLKRFLGGLSYAPPFWNPVWLAPVEPKDMADLLVDSASIEEVYSEALACWASTKSANLIDKTLAFYTNFYLQDDILMKVDRAAMMNGLETRATFLDNDLVAFCERLPARFKFAGGKGKYLLRKALRGVVPDAVLDRPKKGFGVPISRWLRELPAPRGDIAGFKPGAFNRLWCEHAGGEADHRLALWSGLSLEQHLSGMERMRGATITAGAA